MNASSIAGTPADAVRAFASGERWQEGVDFVLGKTRVWLTWESWRDVDDRARVTEEAVRAASGMHEEDDVFSAEAGAPTSEGHGWGTRGRRSMGSMAFGASQEDLLYAAGGLSSAGPNTAATTQLPRQATGNTDWEESVEWDKGSAGPDGYAPVGLSGGDAIDLTRPGKKNGYANLPAGDPNASTVEFNPETKGSAAKSSNATPKPVEVIPTTRARRWWVRFVWFCTWWIPSFMLTYLGGMKRSDIRMAWREKVTICFLILGMCGMVIFYVIIFGKLLCPEFDKAWNADELLGHDRENDFWVSISGSVYDITTFWKGDHSVPGAPMTPDVVKPLAGTDISNFFPPPLELACAGLVTSDRIVMSYANASTVPNPIYAIHTSGTLQSLQVSLTSVSDFVYN
jgi:chitin synthase